MTGCGEWAWYSPEKGVKPFYCGSMSCHRQKCRKLFWTRRVRLISELIKEHELKRFFTLTLDREKIPLSDQPWDYIHHVWSKFRKRMNRRFSDFKFVAVLESHKNKKYPHIHGFTNIWMEQALWSRIWSASGGGTIVWIEAVKSKELSEYVSKQIQVAKYVGKENLEVAYKEKGNHRTLWRSKGLKAKFELDKDSEWSIIKEGVYVDGRVRVFFRKQLGVNAYGQKE